MLRCPISIEGDLRVGPSSPVEFEGGTQTYGVWWLWEPNVELGEALQNLIRDTEKTYQQLFGSTKDLLFAKLVVKRPDPTHEDPYAHNGFTAVKLYLKDKVSGA